MLDCGDGGVRCCLCGGYQAYMLVLVIFVVVLVVVMEVTR